MSNSYPSTAQECHKSHLILINRTISIHAPEKKGLKVRSQNLSTYQKIKIKSKVCQNSDSSKFLEIYIFFFGNFDKNHERFINCKENKKAGEMIRKFFSAHELISNTYLKQGLSTQSTTLHNPNTQILNREQSKRTKDKEAFGSKFLL